jgi:hypothetical protein
VWHAHLGSALRTHGFVPSTTNTSLFLRQHPKVTIYLQVYVDDIILIRYLAFVADRLISELSTYFDVKDLGRMYFSLVWRLLIRMMG